MKLFCSSRSPFTRKVMLVLREYEVAVELVPVVVAFDKATPVDLSRVNPLGQLPTLVTDDGIPLYGSSVICDWLVDLPRAERLVSRRREALADGMCEKTIRRLVENGRENVTAVAALDAALRRAIDVLEDAVAGWGDLDYGLIAVGNALAYLDFRAAALDWRAGHPGLAAWEERFARRPACTALVYGVDLTAMVPA